MNIKTHAMQMNLNLRLRSMLKPLTFQREQYQNGMIGRRHIANRETVGNL